MLKIAALDIEYSGADGTGATTPTEEEVITTCPSSPCSSIAGTNALTPLITPHTLTPISQAQSVISCSHIVSGYAPGAMWEHEINDWAWLIGVNVWGVINGVKAFVPAMLEHGEEGQVVITSSSVGVVAPVPSAPEYSMSKAAIFSIAEMLYAQLRQRNAKITASVLVPPGTINTGLFTATRNRQ